VTATDVARRAFIVEDEAAIALELEDHLVSLGYVVAGVAMRGDRALELIPRARVDVVVMDVNLGRGLSGIEVAERLRPLTDAAIVFLTAYSEEVVDRMLAAGAAGYVLKPFRPEALRATLDRVLESRETGG
jgi:CheY-like chemotaxis protein